MQNVVRGSTFNFKWPFPDLAKPQRWWKLRSKYCVFIVGMLGGKALFTLNKRAIRNHDILIDAVFKRPTGVPLITVSNHESCWDDPALIGLVMTPKQLLDHDNMRWSLAAHDICFTRPLHSAFFSHGKCVPIIRGMGVYQRGVDFCIDRMNEYGDWMHVFPEGRINMEREKLYRLKWGVGRMIAECQTTPLVIPFWHTGMADILPNRKPYFPRIGKSVFVNVGQPLDIQPVVESVRDQSALVKRKVITDFIQSKLEVLREETLVLAAEMKK